MRSDACRAGRDPWLLAILGLAALLLFWHLGARMLWQDEAETALLAKSVLRTGLPIATDGVNVVSQEAGREFGADFLWRWSPWLQFYLAAGSMALLGVTPFAARLPSAILGLLCVPGLYALAKRLFGSPAVARLGALLLALSVPFLLHARQARWHAAATLLLILLLLGVEGLQREERRAPALVVASGSLLFYTNYFIAIGALVALVIAVPALRPGRLYLSRLALSLAATGLLCLPGLIVFDVLGKKGAFDAGQATALLGFYAASFLTYLLPMPLLAILIFVLVRDAAVVPGDQARTWTLFLLLFIVADVAYLSLGPWGMFRYLSLLIPPATLLLAMTMNRIRMRSRAAFGLVLFLFLFTNILHLTPFGFEQTPWPADRSPDAGIFSSPLLGYLHELTHRFDDPEAALCRTLNASARPTDVVLITYGDLPLQFCTRLKVAGGLQGGRLPEAPDWIVVRHFILSSDPGKDLDVASFIQQHIDLKNYEAIDAGATDTMLGNNPDPAFHLFAPPPGAPPLTLLHRRGA